MNLTIPAEQKASRYTQNLLIAVHCWQAVLDDENIFEAEYVLKYNQ